MNLTRRSPGLAWIGLAALTVCTLDVHSAAAQTPDCSTISFVNPIYGTGGSAARPLIGSFAVALRGEADPITIVWSDPGACNAMAALVGPSGTPVNITGTARYWDADGTERQCIHSGAGVAADFGYMAAQPEACAGYSAGLPNTIGNFVDEGFEALKLAAHLYRHMSPAGNVVMADYPAEVLSPLLPPKSNPKGNR